MQLIKEYRARAAMCRAQSNSDSRHRDIWLAEETRWLRKADEEIASQFKECNITYSSDLAHSQASAMRMTRDGRRLAPREYSHASGSAASVAEGERNQSS
jgi:hypothetical protein